MFNLILTNGKEDIIIPFKIRNTNIAKKWYKELCKNYSLYETDRFTNWGPCDLIKDLNFCIDTINNYDPIIHNLSESPTQQDLNYLHKFFEDLRGDVKQGTDWFNNAPTHIQASVEKFNVLIHRLESELRTSNHPTVVVTFKDRPIINLSNDDMKHFTFRWTQGTVYINYCQVGKTVLDVFKDNDKIAEGIRPQEFYSADFMIKFGPTMPYFLYLLRKLYITVWIKLQPFKFKNPNVGMIPVADIVSKIKKEDLTKFNKVKGIRCIA